MVFSLVSCATYQEQIQEEERIKPAPVSVDTKAEKKSSAQDAKEMSIPLTLPPSDAVPPPQADLSKNFSVYLLGPEDVIQVLVWKDENLTQTVTIRPDGKIALPLIGEVQASGLTPGQLANEVRTSLEKYYTEKPEVSVIVTEINSYSVFVLGEIIHPGRQILRTDTTLLQALSIAGGFKEYADTEEILLLRREGALEKRIHVNYKDLISGRNSEENLLLRPGDTIVVP